MTNKKAIFFHYSRESRLTVQITKHFRLQDLTRSQTATRKGISNEPDARAFARLRLLCERILEPLFVHTGGAFAISSGFRCAELNRVVGGAATSQHVKGEAADLVPVSPYSVRSLFELIAASDLPFDQLIYEGTWVHVSFADSPRKELLSATFDAKGKASYRRIERPASQTKIAISATEAKSVEPETKPATAAIASLTVAVEDQRKLLTEAKAVGIGATILTTALAALGDHSAILVAGLLFLGVVFFLFRWKKASRTLPPEKP